MSEPHHGSCLCGAVHYKVTGPISDASHCHCKMCQKAHGAACGTYANVAENQFSIIRGNEHLKNYQSSPSVMRTSCAVCASPLLWVSKTEFPGIISFTLATLAPLFPSYISEIFTLRTKLLGLGIRLKIIIGACNLAIRSCRHRFALRFWVLRYTSPKSHLSRRGITRTLGTAKAAASNMQPLSVSTL